MSERHAELFASIDNVIDDALKHAAQISRIAVARFAASIGNGIAMNMRNMIKMLDLKYKHGTAAGDGKQARLSIEAK